MTSGEGSRGARIFRVQTRFQQMAQRPGIMPDLALAQAASNVDQLNADLDTLLPEAFANLEAALDALDADPADPSARLRAGDGCRDLEAIAEQIGISLIAAIAGSLGDVLSAPPDLIWFDAAIACHRDALVLAMKAGPALPADQTAELVGGLRKVAELSRRLPEA